MTSIDYNVTSFNEFVRLQLDTLTARGESSSDVMVNLFKGYLVAPDKEFSTYIKQKKNNYKEGQDLQEEDLMTMAENKFKSLIRSGEWNAPSKKQKEILVLTAKLESITKKKKSDKSKKCKEKFNGRKRLLRTLWKPKTEMAKHNTGAPSTKCGHFTRQVNAHWKFLKITMTTKKKKEINFS